MVVIFFSHKLVFLNIDSRLIISVSFNIVNLPLICHLKSFTTYLVTLLYNMMAWWIWKAVTILIVYICVHCIVYIILHCILSALEIFLSMRCINLHFTYLLTICRAFLAHRTVASQLLFIDTSLDRTYRKSHLKVTFLDSLYIRLVPRCCTVGSCWCRTFVYNGCPARPVCPVYVILVLL